MKKLLVYFLVLLTLTLVLTACNPNEATSVGSSATQNGISGQSSVNGVSENSTASTKSELESDATSSQTSTEETAVSAEASSEAASTTSKTTSKDNTSKTVSNATSKAVSNVTSKNETSKTVSQPTIKAEKVPQIYITDAKRINRDDFVPAKIKIVDQNGKYPQIMDNEGEIRIRGNSTSAGDKKPYNIKLSTKQDVLGLGKAKKWVLLANMYDKTLMRNKLAFDLSQDIGLDYTSSSAYVDVFVNGKYMGNYLLCEAVDIGESRVDINTRINEFLLEFEPWENYKNPYYIRTPEMNILFGFNAPEQPTQSQYDFLNEFFANAEKALLAKNKTEVERYFDLESIVDFYIVNEYFKNVDFQTSSTRFYIEKGKIHGGPMWDLDLSSGNADFDYYKQYHNYFGTQKSEEGLYCQGIWYKGFLKCEWFYDMVKQRYAQLQPRIINITTDNELGKNKIDTLLAKYGESFNKNFGPDGWNVKIKDSDYERVPFATYKENVEFLRTWLKNRNEWLLKYYNLK